MPAWRSEPGTARMASWALMMMIGRISRPSVRPAETMVRPLAVASPPVPRNEPLVMASRVRTKIARPSIP